MKKFNLSVYNRVDIILNIFRIGGDNRTVVVIVCLCEFIAFIRDAWIKNSPDSFIDQPLDMAVR